MRKRILLAIILCASVLALGCNAVGAPLQEAHKKNALDLKGEPKESNALETMSAPADEEGTYSLVFDGLRFQIPVFWLASPADAAARFYLENGLFVAGFDWADFDEQALKETFSYQTREEALTQHLGFNHASFIEGGEIEPILGMPTYLYTVEQEKYITDVEAWADVENTTCVYILDEFEKRVLMIIFRDKYVSQEERSAFLNNIERYDAYRNLSADGNFLFDLREY